jgi:hypothetical protein
VHISAVGVDTGVGPFSRTKASGETALAALDLDWVILRPGLVVAPAAYGGSALLRGLAGLPWAIPAIHAASTLQVVSVEDLAACAARAIERDAPARITATLVALTPTTLADVLCAIRAWLGFPPAPVVSLPVALGRAGAWAADGLAWLGWRSPMRSAAIAQLASGVGGAPDEGASRLGFAPRSLEQILTGWPSGVQERWFARLYFVKPLALLTLAAFWLTSGLVGLAFRYAAQRMLIHAGMAAPLAGSLVLGGAILDIQLGLLVCFRNTAALALKGMIVVTIVYLAGATVLRPDLWGDPLGPLVKTLPAAVLALAALAMMDER